MKLIRLGRHTLTLSKSWQKYYGRGLHRGPMNTWNLTTSWFTLAWQLSRWL